MIQLNKQFRMNGREILTPKDFCRCYSPTDLLRHRKMAAGFVRHQMAVLSPWHDYHAELLYKAVLQWDIVTEEKNTFKSFHGLSEKEAVNMTEFYLGVPGVWGYMRSKWTSKEYDRFGMLMNETHRKQYLKALTSIWNRVTETDVELEEREQVFMILSAGFFLSMKSLDDLKEYPLSAKDIQLAFRGERAEEKAVPKLTAIGYEFKASIIPYELTKSKMTSISFVDVIEIKKITAVQASNGATNIPVKLNFGGETVEIMPGDYRYASFVDGEWIRIFPIRKEHDGVIMERKGSTIFVTAQNQVTQIDCSQREILDFDVDSQGNYIILEPEYADYYPFSKRHAVVDKLPAENIVEVCIRNDQVFLLDQQGNVFINGKEQNSYPTSLIYCP